MEPHSAVCNVSVKHLTADPVEKERGGIIYSASVKSYQYLNFHILENILYSSMATFTFMFLVNNRLV